MVRRTYYVCLRIASLRVLSEEGDAAVDEGPYTAAVRLGVQGIISHHFNYIIVAFIGGYAQKSMLVYKHIILLARLDMVHRQHAMSEP